MDIQLARFQPDEINSLNDLKNERVKFNCLEKKNFHSLRISLLRFLGSLSSSLVSGLLEGSQGLNTLEEGEFGVLGSDGLDETLLLELVEEHTGDGSVHLELLNEHGAGDAEDLGNFVHELIVALLIKEDVVVKLILDLDLGPALLLCFSSGVL